MTQYMLKMLTIMTNILVTNLIELQSKQQSSTREVSAFIEHVYSCLTQKKGCKDIKSMLSSDTAFDDIPTSNVGDSIERNAISYGC